MLACAMISRVLIYYYALSDDDVRPTSACLSHTSGLSREQVGGRTEQHVIIGFGELAAVD